jgi:hypothetical protein
MLLRAEWIVPFLPRGQYLVFALISREWRRELQRAGYPKRTTRYFKTYSLVTWARAPWDKMTPAGCDLKTLQWLRARDCPWNYVVCISAAERNDIEVLKWAIENGAPCDASCYECAVSVEALDVLWERLGKPKVSCAMPNAARRGDIAVMEWLTQKGFPRRDEECCSSAAAGGHLEALKWLRGVLKARWNNRTFALAAQYGHLHVLQWCAEKKAPYSPLVYNYAAQNGHLHVLQWAGNWNPQVAEYAAYGGHLEILERVDALRVNWDVRYSCALAAKNGKVRVLQWVFDKGLWSDEFIFHILSNSKRVEVIEWFRERDLDLSGQTLYGDFVARSGKLELLEWLYRSADVRILCCSCAVKSGNLRVVKAVHARGAQLSDRDVYTARREGYTDIYNWLLEMGYTPSCFTTQEAVSCGFLDVVEWLHDNSWLVANVCEIAAKADKCDILRWAYERGYGLDSTARHFCARGDLEMVKWVFERGIKLGPEECRSAAAGGHLETLVWLRNQRCTFGVDVCSEAARGGYLGILRWAYAQGCPVDERVLKYAVEGGRVDIIEWATLARKWGVVRK